MDEKKAPQRDALAKRLVNIMKDVCLVVLIAAMFSLAALALHGYVAVQADLKNMVFMPILN